jgi:hypothetical protein
MAGKPAPPERRDPLPSILAGVRSIMCFDARGDAGLTRGLVANLAWLALWLAIAAVVVRRYDRRGLDRVDPEVVAEIDAIRGERAEP